MSLLPRVFRAVSSYAKPSSGLTKATKGASFKPRQPKSLLASFRAQYCSTRQFHTSRVFKYTEDPHKHVHHKTTAAHEATQAPSSEGVFQLGNINDTESHSRMLTLVFTCNKCETRAARQFSHHSYTKGVVIIQCPGCGNHHLIADHLGWFQEGKNVEEFMAKKGESITKITNPDEVTPEMQKYVDEAAAHRAESEVRRQAYRQRREKERAELEQGQAEEANSLNKR